MPQTTLDAAAAVTSQKIWVYYAESKVLVPGAPFSSQHKASSALSISRVTIRKKLNTGIPHNNYLFYSNS